MRVIELDAAGCRTVRAFAARLKTAIGAIEALHGNSIEAFVDSMVHGVHSDLAPPYTVRVSGLEAGPAADFAHDLANAIGQARLDIRKRGKPDVQVVLQVVG